MYGDKSIINTLCGKINNKRFIPGYLNIIGIDISDHTLDIIQNIGLASLSLLAGLSYQQLVKMMKQKYFVLIYIYNKLGRY
jgi:Kef-type K+ transport system membrane component KefB